MLTGFFFHLRDTGLKVSIQEFLALLDALALGVLGPHATEHNPPAQCSLDDFYVLARTTLVKDETQYDKFDRAFGLYFRGAQQLVELKPEIPLEWLRSAGERHFTPEEKTRIAALGGWDKLMDRLRELMKEQHERHEGGSKWIGTRGTSPFGADGYNPEGVRIGQDKSRNRSAVKVWDQRAFRDYDDSVELNTRNIKLALRRLRKFAREGHEEELDLDDTIRSTAANAGWLDIKMVPERKNTVKVLMLMDVGGTMDDHIKQAEELFSAAKSEFKHIEYYYFHN